GYALVVLSVLEGSPATPSLSTTPGGPISLSSSPPPTLTDVAVLSGGFNPTGTLTFTLMAPCGATVAVETRAGSGNGTYTTPIGFTLLTSGAVSGTYHWNASYSGDANNSSASDSGETQVVSNASPNVVGTPSPATVTLGSSPVTLTNTATLSGGF